MRSVEFLIWIEFIFSYQRSFCVCVSVEVHCESHKSLKVLVAAQFFYPLGLLIPGQLSLHANLKHDVEQTCLFEHGVPAEVKLVDEEILHDYRGDPWIILRF